MDCYYGTIIQRLPNADPVEPFNYVHSDDFDTLKEATDWTDSAMETMEHVADAEVHHDPRAHGVRLNYVFRKRNGQWVKESYA